MAVKPYSDEQRRIAAASFDKMSMNIRAKRKAVKIDRDVFFILARVYMAHHAGEILNISQLEEPVGKKHEAVKKKLLVLENKGLIKIEKHPRDARSTDIQVQPPLFDIFGSILDELIELMCMSVECIRRHGARRHRRAEDFDEFCREILTICCLDSAKNPPKSVKQRTD